MSVFAIKLTGWTQTKTPCTSRTFACSAPAAGSIRSSFLLFLFLNPRCPRGPPTSLFSSLFKDPPALDPLHPVPDSDSESESDRWFNPRSRTTNTINK
jgi:hypothetical protein